MAIAGYAGPGTGGKNMITNSNLTICFSKITFSSSNFGGELLLVSGFPCRIHMSSILGDYERPRRPFPIFSLSRDDVHWTIILCVVCFYVAIVIRASQAEHIVEVKSAWKGCLVVFGTILGLMFGALSTAKMCCGYGGYFTDEQKPEYQNLEETKQPEIVIQSTANQPSRGAEKVTAIPSNRSQTLSEMTKQSRFEDARIIRSDDRVSDIMSH
jgi:hypothetical protein